MGSAPRRRVNLKLFALGPTGWLRCKGQRIKTRYKTFTDRKSPRRVAIGGPVWEVDLAVPSVELKTNYILIRIYE